MDGGAVASKRPQHESCPNRSFIHISHSKDIPCREDKVVSDAGAFFFWEAE